MTLRIQRDELDEEPKTEGQQAQRTIGKKIV